MTCNMAHQLIQEALDMPGVTQPALEAHLATCGQCRSYEESMRRIARELSAVQESAPSALMERLGLANPRARQASRRWLPLGVVGAAMLVALGLGPRLQPQPAADPAATVVAEVPGENILDYFGAEPAEADPFGVL